MTRPAAVSGWPGTRPPGQSLFSCTVKTMDGSPHSHRRQDDLLRPAAADRQEGDGGRDGGPEADELCPRGGDRPHLGGLISLPQGVREPEVTYYSATGGSGDLASVMLQPGESGGARGGPAHHSRRLRRRPLPHPAVPGRRLQDGQPRVFVDGRCRRQGIPLYRYLLFYR